MDNNKQHKINTQIERESKALFSQGDVVWKKSKEEVWADTFANLEEKRTKQMYFSNRVKQLSIAATIAILIGTVAFFWFHTKTIHCPAGKHLAVVLPDGSKVHLNASSQVSYKPFTYYLKRELHFEGEAFFEVEKGKKFIVKSEKASTQVLGTTFNIFTRDGEYKITCLTGKVKVSSSINNSVILLPRDYAEVNDNGVIQITNNYNSSREIAWQNNEFFFTGVALSKVLQEIERQYGVKINLAPELDYSVSLNLSTKHKIEDVLDYVCLPRLLTFTKEADGTYNIVQNN